MYADLTLPANTWHSWISEATSTGDHTAIISYEAALKPGLLTAITAETAHIAPYTAGPARPAPRL